MGFLIGGAIAGTLMTFFNVLMILDAVSAAVKWLPRSLPQGEAEQQELRADLCEKVPCTPSKGAFKAGRTLTQTLGLTSEAQLRSTVKVAVAAGKFKKGLKEPLLGKKGD